MSLDNTQELRDLEGQIQTLPWTGQYPEYSTSTAKAVKSWLILKGLSKQKLDNMDWTSTVKCYAIKNYFEVVKGNRPRAIASPRNERKISYGLQTETLIEQEPKTEIYNHDHNQTSLFEEEPSGSGSNSALWRELQALEGKIKNNLKEDLLYNLNNQVNDQTQTIQQEIIRKFNTGELKVQFSDQAKQDLKSLVLATANNFLAQNLPPRETKINIPQKNLNVNVGHVHHEFPTLIQALACKLHVMLVGTASSSKTTSAKMAAQTLDLPFYHMGAAASEFKYAGYEDGHGKYHSTPFRMAFENGGVILLDEYDAGIPAAQMFVQAALANYTCHFPDKIVEAHPDFVCIAACNTFGRGSDRQYVSRNQQDAAALDRFVVLDWDIDEDLEAQLFGDGQKQWDANASHTTTTTPHTTMSSGDWVRYVQKIRHTINDLGERHLVTMRASDFGSRLLAAGMPLAKVEQMCIWKGLNQTTKDKILNHLGTRN